jgi:hypothetical protein
LPLLGPASLLLTMCGWIVTLWAGYVLVFSAFPDDIIRVDTKLAADIWERIYFTGFTIFTLGVGDVTPASDFYRILTAVASISGLFLVTLSITYLLPVLSAVTEKRALACKIHAMGRTPQDIVLNGWDGQSLRSLEPCLLQLTEQISLHAQRHLSYPVLHHFQAETRRDAFPPQLATLSESMMLIRFCMPPDRRPSAICMHMLDQAIDEYIRVIRRVYDHDSHDLAPEAPQLARLREAGIDLCDEDAISKELDAKSEHRRMLLALVHSQAWDWDEAIGVTSKSQDEQNVG